MSAALLPLAGALLGGALLGAFYLWALWMTTRRITTARRPALLMMASLLVRMAVLLGGFWLISDGRWERLVAALGGYLLARVVALWRLNRQAPAGASR